MNTTLTWGTWEDTWDDGHFACIFVAAQSVDGWIEAYGLYQAVDGEKIEDLNTVDEQIARRAVILGYDGASIKVRADYAALMTSLAAHSEDGHMMQSLAHCG